MSMFEEIKSKLSETAKTAVQKSNEFVEITKLSMSLSDVNSKADKTLRDIGKIIYVSYLEGESFDEGITAKCAETDDFYEQASIIKEKIAKLKKVKVCPHCEMENQPDAIFCNKCGKQIDENE